MALPVCSLTCGVLPSRERAVTAPKSWDQANDAVRDIQRMLPTKSSPVLRRLRTYDQKHMAAQHRLYPEVGTASDIRQPGGFRRAHVISSLPADTPPPRYALRALMDTLVRRGGTFVTDVVQVLDDGTEIRYESRPFRRGLRPSVTRGGSATSMEEVEIATPDQRRTIRADQRRTLIEPPGTPTAPLWAWQPRSVPYWTNVCFLAGSVLFTVGSICWMLPHVGDSARGAPAWAVVWSVSYPYFAGSVFFLLGCYLNFVEVINANMQLELLRLQATEQTVAGKATAGQATAGQAAAGQTAAGQAAAASVQREVNEASSPQVKSTRIDSSQREANEASSPQVTCPRDTHTHGASAASEFGIEADTCEGCLGGLHWWSYQPTSMLYWAAVTRPGP